MDKHLKIIEQLQKELDAIFQRLDLNIPNLQNSIFENLMLFVNKLGIYKGNLVASVENLKILRDFNNELANIIGKTNELQKVVTDFAKGLEESTKYVNDYFASMVVGFSSNELLYKAIKQEVISNTLDMLQGTGLQANILNPLKNILTQNITTGGSYQVLKRQFLENVNDDKIKRYVSQIVNDGIMGYERQYMMTIANDLDMKYYFYQGTEKNTTRPFCQNKVGKFFTEQQAKQWADLDWAGKRIGTTKENIFYFAGGYNCRHRILPVSKEIYENNVK